jgi:hypothetical protein
VAEGSGEPVRFAKEESKVREGRLSLCALDKGEGTAGDPEDGELAAGEVSPLRRPGKDRKGDERRLRRGVGGGLAIEGNSTGVPGAIGRGVVSGPSEGDAITGECAERAARSLSISALGMEGRESGGSSPGVEGPSDSAEERAARGKGDVSRGVLCELVAERSDAETEDAESSADTSSNSLETMDAVGSELTITSAADDDASLETGTGRISRMDSRCMALISRTWGSGWDAGSVNDLCHMP